MKIRGVLIEPIRGGFFYDDQAALRAGARLDGEWIAGRAVTEGFAAPRIPATGIGIGLELGDGTVAWGDAISVQYPGVADREPPLVPGEVIPQLRTRLVPELIGLDVSSFREADGRGMEALRDRSLAGKPVEYGLSQALLAAAARAGGCTMAEIVCRDFDFPLIAEPVPIFAQSGDRQYANVDKMIMKRIDALPHGLINNVEKFGPGGETFLEYVRWVVWRIALLSGDGESTGNGGYAPTLHFDLYGIAGKVFADDDQKTGDYLARVAEAAGPLKVRVETPIIASSRAEQIERMAAIRSRLHRDAVPLELVADEWCNTLEDIEAFIAAEACDMAQIKMPDLGSVANSILAARACREANVGSYLGGSCAETDGSARVSVHIAVATQVDQQLAKPGMGVDEGLMIVANEQTRLLAQLRKPGVRS